MGRADSDGCDTCDEVLYMESTTQVFYSSGCSISLGLGALEHHSRFWQDPADVDIDHVVRQESRQRHDSHGRRGRLTGHQRDADDSTSTS